MSDVNDLRDRVITFMMNSQITDEVIDFVTSKAASVIKCVPTYDPDNSQLPSPPSTPTATGSSRQNTSLSDRSIQFPPLNTFIKELAARSKVHTPSFLCTMVYLDRLRQKLPEFARGMQCTCHRIFLAALIITSKYLNDASPKNTYWARYTSIFSLVEVNLMERQLLELLKFDLRITPDELYNQLKGLIAKTNRIGMMLNTTLQLPTNTVYSSQCRYSDSFTHKMSRQNQSTLGPSVKATFRSTKNPSNLYNGKFNTCSLNSTAAQQTLLMISEHWYAPMNQVSNDSTPKPSRKRRQTEFKFHPYETLVTKRNRATNSDPYFDGRISSDSDSVFTMLPPIGQIHPQSCIGSNASPFVHSPPRHSLPNTWEYKFHR